MPSSLEDREEVIVVNDSIDLMRELRREMGKRFPRIWIMLFRDDAQKRYGIEVTGIWGGKLPNAQLESVQDFIEKFMVEHKVDFVKDND